MSVWYDKDDPRNNDDDAGYDEPLCPECGGPACVCKDEPKGFVPVCRACDGTGVLRFDSEPYGRGFGVVTETIPCPCQREGRR